MHLQVENTRACCAAVAAGEANIAIVGGEVPRELEHLLQVWGKNLASLLMECKGRRISFMFISCIVLILLLPPCC